MKIYNSVIIDIATNEIEYEDSFDYKGPICNCKGSSTTINSIDEAYNNRMAGISEKQLGMAEEYFRFWQDSYKPMEQAQIDANMAIIPQRTALQSRMMGQAGNINIDDRMDAAGANAMQQFGNARGGMERNLSRQGIQVGSGRAAAMERDFALEQAKATGGARTQAARTSREDNLRQMAMALG
jgi:hypothetical protein